MRIGSLGDISYLSFGESDLDRPPEADNRFVLCARGYRWRRKDDGGGWLSNHASGYKPTEIVVQQYKIKTL